MKLINANPQSTVKYINKKLSGVHRYCHQNKVDFLNYLGYIQNVLEVAKKKGFIEEWLLPIDPDSNPLVYGAITRQKLPIQIKVPLWV